MNIKYLLPYLLNNIKINNINPNRYINIASLLSFILYSNLLYINDL